MIMISNHFENSEFTLILNPFAKHDFYVVFKSS